MCSCVPESAVRTQKEGKIEIGFLSCCPRTACGPADFGRWFVKSFPPPKSIHDAAPANEQAICYFYFRSLYFKFKFQPGFCLTKGRQLFHCDFTRWAVGLGFFPEKVSWCLDK